MLCIYKLYTGFSSIPGDGMFVLNHGSILYLTPIPKNSATKHDIFLPIHINKMKKMFTIKVAF